MMDSEREPCQHREITTWLSENVPVLWSCAKCDMPFRAQTVVQAPDSEPVAWRHWDPERHRWHFNESTQPETEEDEPLYDHPAQASAPAVRPQVAEVASLLEGDPTGWVTTCPYCLRPLHIGKESWPLASRAAEPAPLTGDSNES